MIKQLILFAGLSILANVGLATDEGSADPWAGLDTYKWDIYIDGTPKGSLPPIDLKAYLVDVSGDTEKTIAYVDIGMYDHVDQGLSYNLDLTKQTQQTKRLKRSL